MQGFVSSLLGQFEICGDLKLASSFAENVFMKSNAPTIKEIAKMLNLSVSTVSRALHRE
jgi:predicted transcriptional regulator